MPRIHAKSQDILAVDNASIWAPSAGQRKICGVRRSNLSQTSFRPSPGSNLLRFTTLELLSSSPTTSRHERIQALALSNQKAGKIFVLHVAKNAQPPERWLSSAVSLGLREICDEWRPGKPGMKLRAWTPRQWRVIGLYVRRLKGSVATPSTKWYSVPLKSPQLSHILLKETGLRRQVSEPGVSPQSHKLFRHFESRYLSATQSMIRAATLA